MTHDPLLAALLLCLGLSIFGASARAAETTLDPVAKDNCIKACNECPRASATGRQPVLAAPR